MAKLYDHDLGQEADVADEEVEQALRSGRFTAPTGTQIPVVGPDGKPGTIAAEEAFDYLNDGFRIEKAEEINERRLQDEYGEGLTNEVLAGAASAFDTATFGLGTRALINSGLASAEDLRELAKRNPIADTVGAAAGVLGTAGTGIASVAKGAEGAVGRALATEGTKGLGRQLLEKAVPMAVGEAVEGAAYGVGQAISEDALGEADLTAEHLIASAGMGALWGGGTGAAFGAGGVLAKQAAKGIGHAIERTGTAIESLYEKATGNKPAKGLGSEAAKLFAKGAEVVSGAEEGKVQQFFGAGGKEARAAATADDGVFEKATRDIAEALDSSNKLARDIEEEAMGGLKLEKVMGLVETGNESAVQQNVLAIVNQTERELDDMVKAGQGVYGYQADLRQAKRFLDAQRKEMVGIIKEAPADQNAKLFIKLDEMKRRIGKFRSNRRMASVSEDQATQKALEELYDNFRVNLEDQGLWGKAAEAQQRINKKWVGYLERNAYKNSFNVLVGEKDFKPIYQANPKAIRGFVDNLKSTSGDLDYDYLTNRVRSQQELIEEIADAYELSPEMVKKVDEARKNVSRFQEVLGDVEKKVVLKNQLRDLERSPNILGALGGGAAGFAVGGPVGAAVGLAGGALARPGHMIRSLATLERVTNQMKSRVSSSVRSFIGAAGAGTKALGGVAQRISVPMSVRALHNVQFGHGRGERDDSKERKPRAWHFDRRMKEIESLMANPATVVEQLTAATAGLAEPAPKIAAAMTEKATAALQFLYDKAPKPPASRVAGISPKKWRPSDMDVARWERYVRAVYDPSSILRDLDRGVVTKEGAETLRTVYPQLHSSIAAEITEHLTEMKQQLPYAKRIQISRLFGVPVDNTASPQFVAMIQQMHAEAEAQAGAQAGGGAAGGSKPPRKYDSKRAESAMTAAQKSEYR